MENRTRELARVNEELLQDIMIRRKAETALRQSEERYRRLTESIADGVVMIKNGRIEFANPAFAEMVGYSAPELLLNSDVYHLIDPEYRQEFGAFLENLPESPKKRRKLPVPVRGKDRKKVLAGRKVQRCSLAGLQGRAGRRQGHYRT